MIRAATGLVKHRDPIKAVQNAVKSSLSKLQSSTADIAILFATPDYRNHYDEILAQIKQLTGARQILGASGYGVLTEESELEESPSLAVMAICSDDLIAESFLVPGLQENNFAAGENVANLLRQSEINFSGMILIPDTLSFQSSAFFDGFENQFGYLPIVGGTAAENGTLNKTFQMAGTASAYDAVCGLALGGNIRMETGITRSCKPFGESLKITRAEGNMIYEIEGRPAYDILLESISQIDFANTDQIFQRVFLGTPLRSFQTDFHASDFLIRHIMGVNIKKGMLACVAPVEEGEFVTFTMRDAEAARHDMQSMLLDLRSRMGDDNPSFGLYFNCCARGLSLYGSPNEDIKLIREFFPNIPLIGFFTYGEIAPIDHVNHLHHHSGVLSFILNK